MALDESEFGVRGSGRGGGAGRDHDEGAVVGVQGRAGLAGEAAGLVFDGRGREVSQLGAGLVNL